MKQKLLKKETVFAMTVGGWLSNSNVLPEEQRQELELLFGITNGKLIKDCERYLQRTIKGIEKGILSLDGFTQEDSECFSGLLNNEKLSKELRKSLTTLIQEGIDGPSA